MEWLAAPSYLADGKKREGGMGLSHKAASRAGGFAALTIGSVAALSLWSATAQAQVTQSTGELEVRLQVSASCDISGSSTGGLGSAILDFGTATLLQDAIDRETSGTEALEVLCNPGVAYTLTFDAGENATVIADRAMKLDGGTALVAYQIYSDAARTTVLNTVSGTGTGTAQAVTVYGRVPAQTAPPPGSYRDVVTVTVAF